MDILNYSKDSISKLNSNTKSSFILTNKKGGFFFGTSDKTFTKFNGLFFPYTANSKTKEWDLMKCIDFIGIPNQADKIENHLSYTKLLKKNAEESFYLNHSNTLIYEINNYNGEVQIDFDCKKIYDDSETGRIYSISKSKGCYVICYEKYKDNTLSELDYKFYIAIKTDLDIVLKNKWFEKNYELDIKREYSSSRWIFNYFNLLVKNKGKIAISYNEKQKLAIDKANEIFENSTYIKRMKTKYYNSLVTCDLNLKEKEQLAYQNSIANFENLICEINSFKGIYAGLPWFFHFWARDEAVSSIALLKEGNYDLMKEILLRWINISGNCRISNRFPNADLGSADATGWIYFRLNQLIKHLSDIKELNNIFTNKELKNLLDDCRKRLTNIEEKYLKEELIWNDSLETWMDTGNEVRDFRNGFRIEIQTLHLAMYEFEIYLSELLKIKSLYIDKKEKFAENIKNKFFKDNYLWDSPEDNTIRPNIFIAYYIYPKLLSKTEWIKCFQIALKELYFEGRILSIPQSHPLFCKEHTGINNKSYHRGDSWYWVDNLTAVCLKKIEHISFKKQIEEIKESSIKAILEEGAIGCLAEISSAKKRTSEGCLSQAWSYAVFIELINELNIKE